MEAYIFDKLKEQHAEMVKILSILSGQIKQLNDNLVKAHGLEDEK